MCDDNVDKEVDLHYVYAQNGIDENLWLKIEKKIKRIFKDKIFWFKKVKGEWMGKYMTENLKKKWRNGNVTFG